MQEYDNSIEGRQFHVAIARLMEVTNKIYKHKDIDQELSRLAYGYLIKGLYPYCPHLASEVWSNCFTTDLESNEDG